MKKTNKTKKSENKVNVENRHLSPRKQAALNRIFRSKAVVINKKKRPLHETLNDEYVDLCVDNLEEVIDNDVISLHGNTIFIN